VPFELRREEVELIGDQLDLDVHAQEQGEIVLCPPAKRRASALDGRRGPEVGVVALREQDFRQVLGNVRVAETLRHAGVDLGEEGEHELDAELPHRVHGA